MKKYIVSAVRIAILTAVAIVVYVKFFEHRLIFFPDREMAGTPLQPFENVYFKTSDDVQLHGWWLPLPTSRRALIISHGNAGNISYRSEMGDFLRGEMGINVLMYDYRGYGQSAGSPSEAGTYSDIRAAYAYVRRRGFEPSSIVLMGQSLGTAITVDLAAEEPIGGVILEAPFTSIAAMARRLFILPLGALVSTKYDSLSKIGRVRAPVAIVHATGDPVIHFQFGRELFEAAKEPKAFFQVDGRLHEGAIMGMGVENFSRLRNFIETGKLGTGH
ncbi:MAG: alpha/beta hydrolase [Acidobacteria bacterium]|nr:alpha/beta hydrolase [Acidobacteriota bacterium]